MNSFFYDFSKEFIAAFLGFLFAIILDRLNAKRESKKRIRSITLSLQNELKDISISVKEYIDKNVVLKHRIATPTWDALQYSGGVMSLMEKVYYDDLLSAYSTIKLYNEERNLLQEKEAMSVMINLVQLSDTVLEAIDKEVKKRVANSKP